MSASTGTIHFRRGAGRLSLDFIRTLRYRGTADVTEELAGPAALAAWIEQFGPAEVDQRNPPRPVQVGEARTLREAIYELLTAARGTGIQSCPAWAVTRINEAAAFPVPAPTLKASGGLHWQADHPVPATLALLARDALDLVTSPAITRVRGCANPTCGALFLDSSRPGTRRWCSMDTCGNIAKKTTLRNRQIAPEAHQ
jgi:predicted RNA-binding Zn ribbon-like protein